MVSCILQEELSGFVEQARGSPLHAPLELMVKSSVHRSSVSMNWLKVGKSYAGKTAVVVSSTTVTPAVVQQTVAVPEGTPHNDDEDRVHSKRKREKKEKEREKKKHKSKKRIKEKHHLKEREKVASSEEHSSAAVLDVDISDHYISDSDSDDARSAIAPNDVELFALVAETPGDDDRDLYGAVACPWEVDAKGDKLLGMNMMNTEVSGPPPPPRRKHKLPSGAMVPIAPRSSSSSKEGKRKVDRIFAQKYEAAAVVLRRKELRMSKEKRY